jgi:Uma2 family endonuclease
MDRFQYSRLIDEGVLDEDDPIELLDGHLLVKEPQHSPHRTAVLLTAKALERVFGDGWFVQTQSPIILDDRSEPEPDVCVVRGAPRDYARAHPMHPALVVEIGSRLCVSPADARPPPTRAAASTSTGS